MSLSNQQMSERRGLVTSSVIPDIAEGNWHRAWRKVHQIEVFDATAATERGDDMEPYVRNRSRKKIAEYMGQSFLRAVKARFVKHENGMFGDSTDVLYVNRGAKVLALGEIKSTIGRLASEQFGEEWTDQVSPYSKFQSCWHLLHHPHVDPCFVSVIVSTEFKFQQQNYVVKRDGEMIGDLQDLATKFWIDHVKGEKEPEPDSTNDTIEFFKKRYLGDVSESYKPATVDLAVLLREHAELSERVKEMEKARAQIDLQLRAYVGNDLGAESDELVVRYTPIAGRPYYDVPKMLRDLEIPADVAEKYKETKGAHRRLFYKFKGESK